ncbi:MAG: cation transporter, partial [Candidatus Onthovivens sp.]
MKETLFNVNMHCSACKGNIENRLKKTKGIK